MYAAHQFSSGHSFSCWGTTDYGDCSRQALINPWPRSTHSQIQNLWTLENQHIRCNWHFLSLKKNILTSSSLSGTIESTNFSTIFSLFSHWQEKKKTTWNNYLKHHKTEWTLQPPGSASQLPSPFKTDPCITFMTKYSGISNART